MENLGPDSEDDTPAGDSDAGAATERDDRTRRWRWWWASAAGLVFAGVVALIVYSDAPEPDVSDLLPRPLVLSAEENLYAHLVEKGAKLLASPLVVEDAVDETAPPLPPTAGGGFFGGEVGGEETEPAPPEYPKLGERLAAGEGWTRERLALFGPALEAVAADARELVVRYPQAQGTILVDHTTRVPANELRTFGEHLRLAAWAKYRAGEQTEAVELAMIGLQLGRRVRDSRGPVIDHLTGMAIMGLLEEPLEAWVNAVETEPATLGCLAAELDELGPMTGRDLQESYVASNRGDFFVFHGMLRDQVTAERCAKEGTGMGKAVDWVAKTRVLFPLIYKRNVTLALNAETWREEIVLARMPIAEEKLRRARPDGCPHCDALDAPWWRPANVYGRYLVVAMAPSFGSVRRTSAKAESRVSALRALVALRLYSLDHYGELPASLGELVPAYLPTVPGDHADGGAIRYSREARSVWSVGVNNLQLTEPDQEIKNEREEMVLRIRFGVAAADTKKGLAESEAR